MCVCVYETFRVETRNRYKCYGRIDYSVTAVGTLSMASTIPSPPSVLISLLVF